MIKTRFLPKNSELSVEITDNGPGIPKEMVDKIFDPFFTTKEVGKGTGLGLSIVFSILEKLGGRIMVASEEGKGTTFTIYLPTK
jgi:two-component system, NtrC family, sensor kinase